MVTSDEYDRLERKTFLTPGERRKLREYRAAIDKMNNLARHEMWPDHRDEPSEEKAEPWNRGKK